MGKLAIILLAAVIGASCSSGSASSARDAAKQTHRYVPPPSSATTSSTTSTTRAPAPKGDAVAIARRLGCSNPKNDTSGQLQLGNIPNPVEEADCVAAGTEFDVEVYASHADLERTDSAGARTLLCSLSKSFGQDGPFYEVLGADFMATASAPTPAGGGDRPIGTLAQAQALGVALGLPVTTITC